VPAGWSVSDIKKRVHVVLCHSSARLGLAGDQPEPPCYGSVWPVVWAFYYPQVFGILGIGLPLEHLDICYDELLDDLP